MSDRTIDEKAMEERRPWRSSTMFVTLVVAMGVTADTVAYSVVIPVFPFQLELLGYKDVSGLTGWLLFIYSIALVVVVPLVITISTRTRRRTNKAFLLVGLAALAAAQILLMEAPAFWMMCIGRLLEGVSSAIIFTIGLVLICNTAPAEAIGGQMGIAMAGVPLGSLLGPSVGGALYARWGFRAPFIFAIILCAVDFVGRVLIVEPSPREGNDGSEGHTTKESDVKASEEKHAIDMPAMDITEIRSGFGVEAASEHTDTEAHDERTHAEIMPKKRSAPLWKVLWRLVTTPRTLVPLMACFCCEFAFTAAQVSMPLHLQAVWHYNSTKVGLVSVAAIVPTLISNPLAGFLSDRVGAEVVAVALFLAGIPWWGALTVQFSVAFFIVCYAIENFFIAAIASPMSAELAAATREMADVEYIHSYGAFTIMTGLGSTAGSIVGGQIYAHSGRGWMIICLLNVGVLAVCGTASFIWSGEKSMGRRWFGSCLRQRHSPGIVAATSGGSA